MIKTIFGILMLAALPVGIVMIFGMYAFGWWITVATLAGAVIIFAWMLTAIWLIEH
jgi:hypothetical protein